jgi:hypothetical protein
MIKYLKVKVKRGYFDLLVEGEVHKVNLIIDKGRDHKGAIVKRGFVLDDKAPYPFVWDADRFEVVEDSDGILDAEPPPNTENQLSESDVRELEYSRMDRGSMHYFIDEHFPDKTADLTSVLHLFGWIDYQTYKADFKIGSVAGFRGSVKPREWYVETQFGGTTVRIWPYGQYVGCRPDGVYHIADVMPSNDLGDGFIIHFLSDGTIKAGRTYEGGH